MKKIIISEESTTIALGLVGEQTPIFCRLRGKLHGMVVKEGKEWILKIGGSAGSSGCHKTREALIKNNQDDFGHEFFIES